MQKASRPGRVKQEGCAQCERLLVADSFEGPTIRLPEWPLKAKFVDVFDAKRLGLTYQPSVDIRAIPMRVCNSVVRTGGDEEAPVTGCRRDLCLVEPVMEKGKAAFEPAA